MSKAQELLEYKLEARLSRCGNFLHDVSTQEVIKFAQEYALACLEKAAEKAVISDWTLEIDKASMDNQEKLV